MREQKYDPQLETALNYQLPPWGEPYEVISYSVEQWGKKLAVRVALRNPEWKSNMVRIRRLTVGVRGAVTTLYDQLI